MTGLDPIYWPFPTLPREQLLGHHLRQIGFLEEAFAEGFRPCKFADEEYLAIAPDGRSAWILSRGGYVKNGGPTRWEVCLNEPNYRRVYFWVRGFDRAAATVLAWLRGGDVESAVALCEGHILRGPTYPDPGDSLVLPGNEPAGLTPP